MSEGLGRSGDAGPEPLVGEEPGQSGCKDRTTQVQVRLRTPMGAAPGLGPGPPMGAELGPQKMLG